MRYLDLEQYPSSWLETMHHEDLAKVQFPVITDRTESDVQRVKTLDRKIADGKATVIEIREYLNRLKGSYNDTDLNRVGEAESYLSSMLKELPQQLKTYREERNVASDALFSVPYDIEEISISPKKNWTMEDIPDTDTMNDYLENLSVLRGALELPENTPSVPETMENLGVDEANEIEEILLAVYTAYKSLSETIHQRIDNTAAAFFYSGEVFCGEV